MRIFLRVDWIGVSSHPPPPPFTHTLCSACAAPQIKSGSVRQARVAKERLKALETEVVARERRLVAEIALPGAELSPTPVTAGASGNGGGGGGNGNTAAVTANVGAARPAPATTTA